MKPQHLLIVAAFAIAPGAPAAAQPPPVSTPVSRADAHGAIGWFNANKDDLESYDDWYNRSVYGGGGFGWYWSDHHKTEVDAGATSAAERYSQRQDVVGTQVLYRFSRYRFSTTRVAVGHLYQFGRNAWVHPFVGGGVDFVWETTNRRDDPLFVYDQAGRQQVVLEPARQHQQTRELSARPFAAAGVKAYMTQRAFFRTDMRLTFEDGVEEVLFRFGIGVDFK